MSLFWKQFRETLENQTHMEVCIKHQVLFTSFL